MPKKGGKKKRDLQEGGSTGAPAEVQPTQSSPSTATGAGPETSTQPPQRGNTQGAPGGFGRGRGPPRQDQQPGQSQTWGQGQSSQASASEQGQSQATDGDEWVSVGQTKTPRGQGRAAPHGGGEGSGSGYGRGQGPRHGPPQQGAWGGQGPRSGPPQQQHQPRGEWRDQGPRSGPSQQQQQPRGDRRDQGPRSGPSQYQQQPQGGWRDQGPPRSGTPHHQQQQQHSQGAWGDQRTGGRGRPQQNQQYQETARPTHSEPMPQAARVPQPVETQPTQSSAWGQPRQQTTSLPQVPQQSGGSEKQAAGVETVAKALSETSMQEKQSTSKAPAFTNVQKKDSKEIMKLPQRKDFNKAGTLGRKITVLTNMMRIIFGPKFKPNVVHYDVDIVPDKPKYLMRPAFIKAQQTLFPGRNPAFDGKKNAYSAGLLPFGITGTATVTVPNEDGNPREFKVTLKKAADGDLDLSWLRNTGPGLQITEGKQSCIQALDIILRMAPVLRPYTTTVGRSFFNPPSPRGPVMSLGGGMDCWVGLFQSAVLGWKPFLNIDVAHKGFPKPQPVIDLIKTICGCDDQGDGNRPPPRGPQGRQQNYGRQGYQGSTELTVDLIEQRKEEINRFLKGLKVVYQIPGQANSRRTQRVNELVTCPRNNSFDHNGHRISVEQYYRLAKSYDIRYPLFPCLWVGGRDKQIHVPMELCTIVPGQATQKKLDENQTSQMIRHAATGTEERKRKIMEAFTGMGYNNDPCMNEFGISVSGQFEAIPARVLDPPSISYKRKDVSVSRGQWNPEVFLESCSTISGDNTWTILNLNFRTQDPELYSFVEQLRSIATRFGVNIGTPSKPFAKIDTRRGCEQNLKSYFDYQKKNNIKLVIVIIPETKGPYCWVKQVAELKSGILTQCLKSKTLFKIEKDRSPATITNILLKINAKLNGVNHKISPQQITSLPYCLKEPCMIVGADVTHPSPDAKDIPSIAAVVASHDPRAFQYNTEIRLQPPREETILELVEIMKTQLEFFHAKTGYWPLRIIYYRDGVGEGYFQRILQRELLAIRAACEKVAPKVGKKYEPPITFLVVQKRHHTRFFPTNPKDSDDKHFNVKAGTVVDTEITHPTDIDFYLCSHASIQGTARPTKYRVLWDDANMDEDEIEKLTYYLCHMFSRCTRSVSYPTPTYYAHLAAFRAKNLTQDIRIDLDNLEQEQRRKLSILHDVSKGTPMFFV